MSGLPPGFDLPGSNVPIIGQKQPVRISEIAWGFQNFILNHPTGHFVFTPLKDITAYELAMIVGQMLFPALQSELMKLTIKQQIPPLNMATVPVEIRRHFTVFANQADLQKWIGEQIAQSESICDFMND